MTPTTPSRLRSLLSSVSSNRRLIFTRFASSLSSLNPDSAAACPRNRTESVFEDHSETGGSAVDIHSVEYSRPSTIQLCQQLSHLHNSISLVGTIVIAPKACNTRHGRPLGCYALLSVKSSPDSNSSFRMLVEMWEEMANVALEHIKPGDCIYVSGRLEFYKTKYSDGNDRLKYKVKVKDLSYVTQCDEHSRFEVEQPQDLKPQGGFNPHGEEHFLNLWRTFFSNPEEWHDWRLNKKNPGSPDFKNKITGKALWMNADDPPWIKRQLELHNYMVQVRCSQDPSSNHDTSSNCAGGINLQEHV